VSERGLRFATCLPGIEGELLVDGRCIVAAKATINYRTWASHSVAAIQPDIYGSLPPGPDLGKKLGFHYAFLYQSRILVYPLYTAPYISYPLTICKV